MKSVLPERSGSEVTSFINRLLAKVLPVLLTGAINCLQAGGLTK